MNYNQKIDDPSGWLHGLKVTQCYTEETQSFTVFYLLCNSVYNPV